MDHTGGYLSAQDRGGTEASRVSEGTAVSATDRPDGPPRRSAVLAWALWTVVLLALPAIAWLNHRLRQVGRPELAPMGESGVP